MAPIPFHLSSISSVFLILASIHVFYTWLSAIRRGWRASQQEKNDSEQPLPAKPPPVSIIVPAWNERGTIEPCIHSLQEITYPYWEAIILAGGQDGTYEATLEAIADDSRFRVFVRGPEGKNVVLTRGIDAAMYDILVLLDADSIVAPDWLNKLVAPLLSGASATYGFYLPQKWTWVSTAEYMQQIEYHNKKSPIFPGCASEAIRRESLVSSGSLTAEAYSWEDLDVVARLLKVNGQIIPVGQAKLISNRPTTLGEYWRFTLRTFRAQMAGLWYHRKTFLRHPKDAFYGFFFIGYGALLSLAMIAAILAVVVQPSLLPIVITWMVLLAFWIFGRRAALAGEVAAYKHELKWLAWFWAPVAILFAQIWAALFSILTVWKQSSFDYKGQRDTFI